jgi:hypothetical protein
LATASSSSSAPEFEPATSSSKILHDFQKTGGSGDKSRRRPQDASATSSRAALNRLTDSTAVFSRSLADSSSGHNVHFTHRHHHHGHHGHVQPQQQSTSNQPEPDIQVK